MVTKPLMGKVVIKGIVHTLTGLHIGTSKEVLEIGSIDLAVIRDAVSNEPYIPGSSLKGKMRSLLERKIAGEKSDPRFFNRNIGRPNYPINIHACEDKESAFNCPICRVFGTSAGKGDSASNFPARIKVRDAFFTGYTRTELSQTPTGSLFTEVKFENALDRVTAASNPRQIERVPAGADFVFEIVYDVEELGHLEVDLRNILFALEAIQDDSIGGHGSRGYGKVEFYITEVTAKKVDAYYKGVNENNTCSIKCDGIAAIDRTTTTKPDYKRLMKVTDIRDKLSRIVNFFAEKSS